MSGIDDLNRAHLFYASVAINFDTIMIFVWFKTDAKGKMVLGRHHQDFQIRSITQSE